MVCIICVKDMCKTGGKKVIVPQKKDVGYVCIKKYS
jgi:hypothetical protein